MSSAADITQDQLALTQAEQARSAATLTAPIDGTVGAVGMTAGQTATSASTITIVGGGDAAVTVDVPLSAMPSLSVGEPAQVSIGGTTGSLTGSVTQIGILPASTSGSTPTYPVTVVVPDAPQALATGISAEVAITTKQASNVMTVPVSALTMVGTGRASVGIVKGSTIQDAVVTVGAVGDGRAQVTSGLTVGETVVFADLSQPLPTNNAGQSGSLTGGGFAGGRGRLSGSGGN